MKATNSDDEPVPINTSVVTSSILLPSLFCRSVNAVGLYKIFVPFEVVG